MRTVSQLITEEADRLLKGIKELLGEENIHLTDLNANSEGIFHLGPHYAFPPLDDLEKKRLQSRLIDEHKRFFDLINTLLREKVNSYELDAWTNTLRDIIEQRLVWQPTTDKVYEEAKTVMMKILESISYLYDPVEGAVILIPDTNALIFSPAFHDWSFDGIEKFEILLISTVLEELDRLKIEHRNPEVRDKAKRVIAQIKEYRRRGSLNEGVTVVKERVRLRSRATEPRVVETLPWLDPNSQDDRILASVIETMRTHVRSAVILVTSDINLQNKAELARIPFLEPPSI